MTRSSTARPRLAVAVAFRVAVVASLVLVVVAALHLMGMVEAVPLLFFSAFNLLERLATVAPDAVGRGKTRKRRRLHPVSARLSDAQRDAPERDAGPWSASWRRLAYAEA